MSDDDEVEVEEGGGGGGNKKLIAVGLVALLLGVGGGFAASTFIPSADAATEAPEGEEGAEGEVEEDLASRVVLPLDTFTVNLRGSSGSRVLRLEVQLEVEGSDEEAINTGIPAMRDAVISLASDYAFAELEGIDGKMHFRDELLGRLNRVLDGPRVQRVYFTEFVVH